MLAWEDDVGEAASHGAYLVGSRDLSDADAADGTMDGMIELGRVAALDNSWKLVGSAAYSWPSERKIGVGDVDGDGQPDLVLKGPLASVVIDVLSGARGDLARIDLADGSNDGVIDLGRVGSTERTWKLVAEGRGRYVDLVDIDSDGLADLLVGGDGAPSIAHLVSASSFVQGGHGTLRLEELSLTADSYQFRWQGAQGLRFAKVASLEDADGDGLGDFAVTVQLSESTDGDAAYVIFGADLPILDSADGLRDSVIDLGQIQGALR